MLILRTCKKCKCEKNYISFIIIINGEEDIVRICDTCRIPRKNQTKKEKLYKTNKYRKFKYHNDTLFNLKSRIRNIIYLSIVQRKGYTKKSKTGDILGCDFNFFINYIEAQFVEGMTWDNIHLDHIKPLKLATTEKEVLELNHYTNFQPLLIADNLKKSTTFTEKQLRLL